ncbi:hypothetical protein AVEN_203685-1 [Araneus ventricosus]|uniref:DUF5641 domain-containing protein n=1 Tax=Araneus ventricosus TaxID=182803 RepID=A0A4Y2EWR4_ARAVE|nr:hypothetical protein AVEN_203685-1 [Araneus ventricosus]
MHKQRKASIKCHASMHWSELLSSILLGMRACLKDDVGVSPAELVYGQCLCLPGEFIRDSVPPSRILTDADLVQKLRTFVSKLRPVSASHHSSDDHSFVHPDLKSASHVFIRRGTIRRPLEQPCPYKVLRRKKIFFCIKINRKEATVSIDRLKPTYFLVEQSSPHSSFPDHRSNPVSDSVVTSSGR